MIDSYSELLAYLIVGNLNEINRFLDNIIKAGSINEQDKNGETILHHLTKTPFCLMELIIKCVENGADLNIQDKSGNTILHNVLYYTNNIELVNYLIENGADINIKNKKFIAPIELAKLQKILSESEQEKE